MNWLKAFLVGFMVLIVLALATLLVKYSFTVTMEWSMTDIAVELTLLQFLQFATLVFLVKWKYFDKEKTDANKDTGNSGTIMPLNNRDS